MDETGLHGENAEAVIRKVHELFVRKGLSLAAAESCTGGLLSHYLTSLPGASAFFVAGVVTYSNKAKTEVLGISPETLREYGAVSEETAREMAERARSVAQTDCAVATTGNLGPAVLEGKEKGLVYIAVAGGGGTFSKVLRCGGDRAANKSESARAALKFLIEIIEPLP